MAYCPNCSAKLETTAADSCWNCLASFGEGSVWKPLPSPVGSFRRFTQRAAIPKKAPGAEAYRPRSTSERVVNGIGCGILIAIFGIPAALLLLLLILDPCLICK
jgi:hypothetical protein